MARSERCERTDLLVDQCAHCRGSGDPFPLPGGSNTTSRPFDAKFRSECGAGDQIEVGDTIVMYAEEAWHAGCAETDGARVPGLNAPLIRPVRNPPPRPARRALEDPYG